MVLWALFLVPAIAGGMCFMLRREALRRCLLTTTALVHMLLVGMCWLRRPHLTPGAWIGLDAPGLLFLSLASAVFLCCAGYLLQHRDARDRPCEEGLLFSASPDAMFSGCLLLFLATMSLVTVSRHLGLLWVAVEATTLASAPLIYYQRHPNSLEATWKYLLICSIGIALAMLGNIFIAIAGSASAAQPVHLTLDALRQHAPQLDPVWLRAAFALCLVGYGTKMGLAPMHTWLPDAHSEAPCPVSALLSGALLNCAFLAILRVHGVMVAAGLQQTSCALLVVLGLVSMVVAAVFVIRQPDFKRLLAYSSVEHMGILALGVGLGGSAVFGSLLHAVNHSLAKALLFLVAGNLLACYQTKRVGAVRGALATVPVTATLWVAGILAVTGSPPFGLFISELTILQGALATQRYAVAAIYLLALAIIFAAMLRIALDMTLAPQQPAATPPRREPVWSLAPLFVLGGAVLVLGLYVPPWLSGLLHQAAQAAGGS